MKKFFTILCFAVFAVSSAWAQFSVEEKNKSLQEKVKIGNANMKSIATSTSYQSDARDRLERQRLRKQRNYLELTTSINADMTMYNEAWLDRRGGDNTFTVSGRIFMKHQYNKDKFNVTTQFEGNYGYNRITIEETDEEGNKTKKGNWFKNVDNFWLQSQPARTMNNKWSYSGLFKLRSQFTKSYNNRLKQIDDNVVTSFLAPGYLDVSLGFVYKSGKPKFPIQLTLNPLSSSGTVAYNDLVEELYRKRKATNWFGIDMGKHATFSGGSSINIAFSRHFGKNNWLQYWTNCYVYYGWITNVMNHNKIHDYYAYLREKRHFDSWVKTDNAYKDWEKRYDEWLNTPVENRGDEPIAPVKPEGDKPATPVAKPYHVELHPTVEWKNTFTIKTAKYLTTTIMVNMFYNKAASDKVEIQSQLKLGFSYSINNRK